jgi:hypothetical protein
LALKTLKTWSQFQYCLNMLRVKPKNVILLFECKVYFAFTFKGDITVTWK